VRSSDGHRGRTGAAATWKVRTGAAVLLVLVVALGAVVPAQGRPSSSADSGGDQAKVRAERAKVAAELDVSRASFAEVVKALQTLEENRRVQESALAAANLRLVAVQAEETKARRAVRKVDREVTMLKAEVRRRAVDAFVRPPTENLVTSLASHDYLTASEQMFFIGLRDDQDAEVARRLDRAQARLRTQRRRLAVFRSAVDRDRAQQRERLAATDAAKVGQQTLLFNIQANISTQIQRSIDLAAKDRSLAGEIASQQALLQSQLFAQHSGATSTGGPITDTQASDGSETGPLPPGVTSSGGPSGVSLCDVQGITVNCLIAQPVTDLLNAARFDGLVLLGAGYRSPQQQIDLRRAHCGSSDFAIYQMDANACHPPTARPGMSQHEIGLAIDFSNAMTRDSAGYQWLSAHAADFGFYNLPTEPWHWSTTGN